MKTQGEIEAAVCAGIKPMRSGLRTLLIGGLAAGAAFTIAKLIA